MMNNPLIDSALTEVWEWREQLRQTCAGMSATEEIAFIHQDVERFLLSHGFKLVPLGNGSSKLQKMDSSSLN